MKFRLPIVVLLTLLMCPALHGQNIQVGAKAGLSIVNFVGDKDTNFDSKVALVGGFPLFFPINRNVTISPEILYAQKGAETLTTLDDVPIEASFSVLYLEVPVLMRYVVSPRSKISPMVAAGPVASWNFDARVRYNAVGSNVDFNESDDSIRDLDFGVAVAAGLDFAWDLRRITIEMRYTRGISNLVDKPEDPKHNGVISLMAGVGL